MTLPLKQPKKARKKVFFKFLLLMFSTLISLAFAEIVLRITIDQMNYNLKPETYIHPALGKRTIVGNSSGHDAEGFRNRNIPQKADIILVGDSHTYCWGVFYEDSWPQILARLTGKTVYNMSVPGYGVAQYHYLVKKAVKKNPETIVVGFYFGNDLLDTFQTIYGHDYWSKYRTSKIPKKNKQQKQHYNKSFYENGIHLLASNSVLYSRFKTSPLGMLLRGHKNKNSRFIIQDKNGKDIAYFKKESRLKHLNLKEARIVEGFEKSMILLEEMKLICDENGIHFVVLVIPIKETIFEQHLGEEMTNLLESISYQKKIEKMMLSHFREKGIPYTLALPKLIEKSKVTNLYSLDDGHPNQVGYSIYADTVFEYIKQLEKSGKEKNE